MSKIIEFTLAMGRPRRPDGDIDAVIRQQDLEEIILLGRRAHEAVDDWKKKHQRLLWMVLHGIPIEPGVHAARAVQVKKNAHQVRASEFWRLVVK